MRSIVISRKNCHPDRSEGWIKYIEIDFRDPGSIDPGFLFYSHIAGGKHIYLK